MKIARMMIVLVGVFLPYIVRIPRGADFTAQYLELDKDGHAFIFAFNAIAWGSLLAISFLYRHPASLLAPCGLGFSYLAWAHFMNDLAAEALASIAFIFIPIYALLPIGMGAFFGMIVDGSLESKNRGTSKHDDDRSETST